jgi:hypothetical protein
VFICCNLKMNIMAHNLQSIFKGLIGALASITVITLIASSCTKSSSGNAGAQFAGTWTGTSSCGSGAASFVLTASGNTVSTTGTVGSTGCVKSITLSGTASGSNVVFPATNYTDGCGLSYTISAAASLSGGVLTLTESVTGAVTASCTFTGTN